MELRERKVVRKFKVFNVLSFLVLFRLKSLLQLIKRRKSRHKCVLILNLRFYRFVTIASITLSASFCEFSCTISNGEKAAIITKTTWKHWTFSWSITKGTWECFESFNSKGNIHEARNFDQKLVFHLRFCYRCFYCAFIELLLLLQELNICEKEKKRFQKTRCKCKCLMRLHRRLHGRLHVGFHERCSRFIRNKARCR